MTIEKFESKDGGSYRYIHEDDKGNQYFFRGVNHEVLSPERTIGTFEFEGLPEWGHGCFAISAALCDLCV